MTHEFDPALPEGRDPCARNSGILLAVAALLMVFFMALHPRIHADHGADFTEAVALVATRNAVIHGALIAVLVLLFTGLLGLAERLGLHLMPVRLGLVACALGAVALIAAAALNGFAVAELAAELREHDRTAAGLEPLFMLCHAINTAAARIGVVALSAAVLLWSFVLAHRTGASRLVGLLGLVVAAAPPLFMFAGHLPMNLHGFGAFILTQSVWYLAVAAQLIRNRL
jgi:hypothetical protein